MKLIAVVAIVSFLFTQRVNAQVVLENEYPSVTQIFTLVPIDSGLYKYVNVDHAYDVVTLYNMDHTVYMTIPFPTILQGTMVSKFFYFTRRLFDCDSSHLEYLVEYQNSSSCGVSVYQDDGTLLFNEPDFSLSPLTLGQLGFYQGSVYNTPDGAKLILRPCIISNLDFHIARVYSLCGALPQIFSSQLDLNNDNYIAAFPNPTRNDLTISYELPEGSHKAELLIHDMNGTIVKQYTVTDAFNNVRLSLNALPPGTYTYSIKTDNEMIPSGKFIKVD
jgi:hypothetical protein